MHNFHIAASILVAAWTSLNPMVADSENRFSCDDVYFNTLHGIDELSLMLTLAFKAVGKSVWNAL